MVCRLCRRDKPVTEFAWKNKGLGKLQKICKVCHNVNYGQVWYKKNRVSVINRISANRRANTKIVRKFIYEYLKSHPCVDCNEPDPIVLEFDHVTGKKRYNLGKMTTTGFSLNKVKEEMEKCVVRCANCHRRRTAQDQKWYRMINQ